MKRIVLVFALLVSMLTTGTAIGQVQVYRLDAALNGTVITMTGGTLVLRDDDSQGAGAPEAGSPMHGIDYFVTLEMGCSGATRIVFYVSELSISCLDTLYFYDGIDTNGTLIAKFNSFTGNMAQGNRFFETPSNISGKVTVRFKTDPLTDTNRTHLSCFTNSSVGTGFSLTARCEIPCATVIPVIDSEFYRTRNGVVYDTAYIHEISYPDTIYNIEGDTTSGILSIDTVRFMGANLCIGDGVIFRGHGVYTNITNYYTPSDATSYFIWDMANEGDSIEGLGRTEITYSEYQRTSCYDMKLDIVDANGCTNDMITSIRVRTALNPIKTIFKLQDICNSDSLLVNMGYSGDATLTLQRIKSDSTHSQTNEVRTFIPDGCSCQTPTYYEAPVEFTDFPNNRSVTSAKDICSLCVNMEHSFMGDFYMTLVCPTGQESIIKFGNPTAQGCDYPLNENGDPVQRPDPTNTPGGSYGSGTFLGFPLDGSPWDAEPKCDSVKNPYGIGLDYCFSRDTNYTLVTGDNAAAVWSALIPNPVGDFYIVSSGYVDNLPVSFPPVPAGFDVAGQTPSNTSMSTKHPSNHDEKTDYYLPFSTFSELIGCPLNGTWKVRVYDTWGIDNGWIFNWTLDICDVMQGDCDYQVPIDSLVWMPDPSPQYHDYDLGHYRGLKVKAESEVVSHVMSPDTAGTFRVLVKVYDSFGCVWDTNTNITTHWTPVPNLGPDTGLCGVDRMILDASDRYTDTLHYTYIWEPFGETTPTIMTTEEPGHDMVYVVNALHYAPNGIVCEAYDTINIAIRRQPIPRFVANPFTFEGCAPFTMNFENQSIDAVEHLWDFGDGITSSLASPSHTYGAGIYDLRYYSISADGCIDSVVSPGAIAVYDAPNASFTWSPTYPSVVNPVATFTNLTTPHTSQTKYFWEIQYNVENPLSVETFTDRNPVYDFSTYTEGDPSGNYAVRLIARTDNLAPSGNMVYCRDTAENTILVVNDFLQFPNVVSPNGDGINDRFVIKNLIEGLGYPINSLDIYNKWGTRVYHKDNISRDEDFWDPKDMPTGTYFYRFSARGYNGNVEHNGALEVVR